MFESGAALTRGVEYPRYRHDHPMITEERERHDGVTPWVWALCASLLVHLLGLGFLPSLWERSVRDANRPIETETVVASTAVRLERRPVARPLSHPVPVAPQQPKAIPRPASLAAAPRRHELARAAPAAEPQPTPPSARKAQSLDEQLAQQERNFSQEVARLNARNAPFSVATPGREPPASFRRTYFDMPGHKQRDAVEAILIPLRHWYAQSLSCYYVRYVAQFTSGGSEDGVIPWPVCYAVNDDRMANPPYPHDLPIPIPQRDYVLPSGTYLTPLLKSIYDRRG